MFHSVFQKLLSMLNMHVISMQLAQKEPPKANGGNVRAKKVLKEMDGQNATSLFNVSYFFGNKLFRMAS